MAMKTHLKEDLSILHSHADCWKQIRTAEKQLMDTRRQLVTAKSQLAYLKARMVDAGIPIELPRLLQDWELEDDEHSIEVKLD